MVRKLSFAFALVFVLVVVTGWMPHFVTDTHMTMDGPERTLFGLFGMSILDDVTHGLSALLLLAASIKSRKASLLALTAFIHKPIVANILLNLPHVIIATIMLGMVYGLAPREDLRLGTARVATSAG
jgi:hypothetical protein